MLVGIDLDNTIIRYDRCLHSIALKRGLIDARVPQRKREIRDAVRRNHDDIQWQKLQIAIYGSSINEAELMPGVRDFLVGLKKAGHEVKIVSHKTRYPNYGGLKIDLRQCAFDFLREKGFFDPDGPGLDESDVFFHSTRQEKVAGIRELGCDVFIDDLEEVFAEPDFPAEVSKILFSPDRADSGIAGAVVLGDFGKIAEYIFRLLGGGHE